MRLSSNSSSLRRSSSSGASPSSRLRLSCSRFSVRRSDCVSRRSRAWRVESCWARSEPRPYRQLVGVILVLRGFLAHAVKALAQAVALGQRRFALLGCRWAMAVERVLQVQARFAELLVLPGRAARASSATSSSSRRRRRSSCSAWALLADSWAFDFALLARFVLQQPAQVFAAGLPADAGWRAGSAVGFQALPGSASRSSRWRSALRFPGRGPVRRFPLRWRGAPARNAGRPSSRRG